MSKSDNPEDPPIRKSMSLPKSMWDDIAEFRFAQRIGTEAEAIRRLIQSALKAARRGK
jgi:hypothetical protein